MSTTTIEKQETVAAPKNEKRTERATAEIHTAAMELKIVSAEPAESYPSCLDLAADFMARG